MERHTVVLVPVSDYDEQKVTEAVNTGISLLGGWECFVSKDEKILLKPNLLTGSLPQKAVTTHPAVFGAVAASLREAGYRYLQYGDSPGNPATSPEKAADTSGILEQAEKYGVERADFDGGCVVRFPEGKTARSFYLCTGVQQADALISICKMKTHALERITGAVKNQYGCICGVNKAAGHALYPSSEKFAEMLTDLHRCVKPRLHIMDGITAMEGNGPSSGTPVQMNVLLFSADPVALDTVFCNLIDLDPVSVPTCTAGAHAGIGTMNPDEIRIVTPDGEISAERAAELYGKADFDVFREKLRKSLFMKFLPLLPSLQHRPKADMKRCVGCGICQEACPVPEKAVKSGNGKKAEYDYKKCIRFYCCQEMCPVKAISVYRSPLNKLLGGK
ncbi:MAG: DUF362 domain-containing protein [Clostridia bacterium]|nr:DUF362 domain-containing protein [Clostridia bacterium]